ncbi:hypothetical protein [Chitinimonas lacunae]|uniref:Uncharacterized protein n=1 Tax=Chitinimonas lacunae TaxID=1963018 RepID=A0ABV8MRZ3_9NEIS
MSPLTFCAGRRSRPAAGPSSSVAAPTPAPAASPAPATQTDPPSIWRPRSPTS